VGRLVALTGDAVRGAASDRSGDLTALAQALVASALGAGADAADAFLRDGPVHRRTQHQGQIAESHGWHSEVSLRTWCGGTCSLTTANDLNPSGFRLLARRSVDSARQWGVQRPAILQGETSPLGWDRSVPDEPESGKGWAVLEQALAAVRSEPTLASALVSGSYSMAALTTALATSHGFAAEYCHQEHRVWLWIEGSDGHLVTAQAARRASELDPTSLGAHLAQRAGALGPSAIASNGVAAGRCAVLLPPLVGADLARALGFLLSGDNVVEHLRPLLGRIGKPIAASSVTLIDDGAADESVNGRPFDDEGTPTACAALIDKGRLSELLHTRASAAWLGVAPNGKATRARPWRHPQSAPTTVYLAPGDCTPDDLQRQMRHGLVVTSALRPGRIHAATGRFNVLVRGWWVENGEAVRAVSGVPLSANIFELLRSVNATACDLQFSPLADGAGAPSVLIDALTVG
jgi:predicted Zn-dependent protease